MFSNNVLITMYFEILFHFFHFISFHSDVCPMKTKRQNQGTSISTRPSNFNLIVQNFSVFLILIANYVYSVHTRMHMRTHTYTPTFASIGGESREIQRDLNDGKTCDSFRESGVYSLSVSRKQFFSLLNETFDHHHLIHSSLYRNK